MNTITQSDFLNLRKGDTIRVFDDTKHVVVSVSKDDNDFKITTVDDWFYGNQVLEIYKNIIAELPETTSITALKNKIMDKRSIIRDEGIDATEITVNLPRASYTVITDTVSMYLEKYKNSKNNSVVTECVSILNTYNNNNKKEVLAEVIIKLTEELHKQLA